MEGKDIEPLRSFYKKKGSSVRFSKLSNHVVEALSDKVEKLKDMLHDLGDIDPDSVNAAETSAECVKLIKEKNLFNTRDVIYMQFLLKETGCNDVYEKCIEYAKQENALCFYETPPDNGYIQPKFHVCGNLLEYNKEDIDCIQQTVADMLDCTADEIQIAGFHHSQSFFLILSIKEKYSKDLIALNQHQCERLWSLKVDYFIVGDKKICTESTRSNEAGLPTNLQQNNSSQLTLEKLPVLSSDEISHADSTGLSGIWLKSKPKKHNDGKEDKWRGRESQMKTNVSIPLQMKMKGDHWVNIFTNLAKGKTMMYHASGMIIGCAGSGKTTLLRRLKSIDLKEIQKNTTSTRGIVVQSDIFDVTDTIKVNLSNHRQRFKVRLDEKFQEKFDQGDPVKLRKTVNIDEPEDIDELFSKEEETSQEYINIETINKEKAAAFFEKGVKMAGKNQNVAELKQNLEILRVSKNESDDPEGKITMVDFAGKCAYYASHQIFLSPRAFFILVLNMEKKFDEKIEEEGCVYNGWTHRDYLMFWAKSIQEYSSDKAPILLVGTHAEKKTKQEEMLFFREIWKTLKMEKSLHKHLHPKRRFAIGFHNDESIEKIKLSIADVVHQLGHWGEELPLSWAFFKQFFLKKKYLKIINKEALLAFNENLPHDIKLENFEDINIMLQFFHDIKEILYFDQNVLSEFIILDVQWFADAFKNVITDKKHANEDLFEFVSEWDLFNETGVLHDNLLCAIWKMNNSDYIEHKNNIMLYMEKLGLLAKVGDKKWYVPSMNKILFPVDRFIKYPASSILCYKFDVFPAGIFHHLVATCMHIPWAIFEDEDRRCIYQTAAVFVFPDQHHNILIGMTQTEIQLQVFVTEGEIDVSTCHQIRERIESELHKLSKTFQKNSEFHVAFKCKPTGFCDSKESAAVNESKFTRATFPCPSCPASKKHIINTKEITKYWKQEKEKNVDKDGKLSILFDTLERTPTKKN